MWQCTQQHENRDEAKFCGKCGEKRETRVLCSQCGTILEPDDVFCTSCGHPRNTEPKPAPAPVVAPVAPVQVTQPVEAAPTEIPATIAAPPEEPAPEEPKDEPVTFSFGGAMIEMKDDPSKPDRLKKPSGGKRGMSSTMTAILSFALIAAVLWLALYLITRR